jgi:hypothetical protein
MGTSASSSNSGGGGGRSAQPLKSDTTTELVAVKAKQGITKTPSVVASLVAAKVRQRALTVDQGPARGFSFSSKAAGGSLRRISGRSLRGPASASAPRAKIGKLDSANFVSDDGKRSMPVAKAKRCFAEALAKSPLLSQTPAELREALFKEAVPVFVTKGDVLFEKGSYSQIMFVVAQGALAYLDQKHKLRDQAVAEHCVLVNSPHDVTCLVVETGVVLAVHRFQYQMAAVRCVPAGRGAADVWAGWRRGWRPRTCARRRSTWRCSRRCLPRSASGCWTRPRRWSSARASAFSRPTTCCKVRARAEPGRG